MATVGTGRGVNAIAAIWAKRSASTPSITSGSSSVNRSSSDTDARIAAQCGGLQLGEHLRDVLERAVLQQPGEQQVANLEQRQVFFVVDLSGRQQPGRLEVEQRRGDHQERGGFLQVQLATDLAGVGDEVVGDLVQRHLGDVETMGEDQLQQQIERPLEVGQADLEAVLGWRLTIRAVPFTRRIGR